VKVAIRILKTEEEQGNVKRVNEEGGHDGDDASR
jgi:hypothetical protein